MWKYVPDWPSEPVVVPENIIPFHDDRFGPLVNIFPRKFKSRKKLRSINPVIAAIDTGSYIRNNREVRVLRLDRYLPLDNPKTDFLIHLGIGHFKNNNYSQKSPYIFLYNNKIYARVSIPGKKMRKHKHFIKSRKEFASRYTTICWATTESGYPMYSLSTSYLRICYMGFYEVKIEGTEIHDLVQNRLDRLANYISEYKPLG